MSRRNKLLIPRSIVFLAIGILALFFARGWSFWIVLLVIAIHLCVEVLALRMPAELRELSSCNCLRMDGTSSKRRSDREQQAMRKIRSDLWAIFLVVVFAGVTGLFLLQAIFPLSLVGDVVAAAVDSSHDFKMALKERGVDDQYFQWAQNTSRSSNEEILQRQETLWVAWPIVVGLVLAALVGCLLLVRFAYFRTLREFEAGVKARSADYLNLDISRLQG